MVIGKTSEDGSDAPGHAALIKNREENHLFATITSNLAYYLSIEGNAEEVDEAIGLYSNPIVKESYFTSMCWHNKAYGWLKKFEIVIHQNQDLEVLTTIYETALNCFLRADQLRISPVDIKKLKEHIFVSDPQISKEQYPSYCGVFLQLTHLIEGPH